MGPGEILEIAERLGGRIAHEPAEIEARVASGRDDQPGQGRELRHHERDRCADGKPLAVVPLPMPPPLEIDGQRCPASYANFYLANGCALVPVFGAGEDARALAILRELLPGRDVVGIPCADLVQGLGALHCLSQQEPA